jgi:hypothetical protein
MLMPAILLPMMIAGIVVADAIANIYANATADRLSRNTYAAAITTIATIPLPIDNPTTATNYYTSNHHIDDTRIHHIWKEDPCLASM